MRGRKGKKWTSIYAVIGANVFGKPIFMDRINEVAIAGGLVNAVNTAVYQKVPAGPEADSVVPQQFLTLFDCFSCTGR